MMKSKMSSRASAISDANFLASSMIDKEKKELEKL